MHFICYNDFVGFAQDKVKQSPQKPLDSTHMRLLSQTQQDVKNKSYERAQKHAHISYIYKMKKTAKSGILPIILILALLFPLSGCSATQPYTEGSGELRIVCTTFAPFDFARVVGGDHVTVTILQDSGSDLHNYTPTGATLEALSQADLFIYVGGTSDHAWVHDAITASENSDLHSLRLMDGISPVFAELSCDWSEEHSHDNTGEHNDNEHMDYDQLDEHDHPNAIDPDNTHSDEHGDHDDHDGHHHDADEHVWTSLRNAIACIDMITDTLVVLDPENADHYRTNASEYTRKLNLLDKEYAEVVSTMPTPMVIADRFPFVYLTRDYKIPYLAAFSGCSTEVNSSFEMQIGLIKAVRESEIPYVVTIEGNDKSLAEAIATETGCEIISLNSLQSVKRSDITSGISYLEVMTKNLEVLKEANRCH